MGDAGNAELLDRSWQPEIERVGTESRAEIEECQDIDFRVGERAEYRLATVWVDCIRVERCLVMSHQLLM
ncbi:hypothetical protein D3C78_1771680 [compost metagenome]